MPPDDPSIETYDFGGGPVPARRHGYGGGWIADSARADDSVYIGPNALVYGDARLYNNVSIQGHARVYGSSILKDDARITDTARVEHTVIAGSVYVGDRCTVRGSALSGSVVLQGDVSVSESTLQGTTLAEGGFNIRESRVSGLSVIRAALSHASLVDAVVQPGACMMHDGVRNTEPFVFLTGICYDGTFPPPVQAEPEFQDDSDEADGDYEDEEGSSAAVAAPPIDLKKGRLAGIEWEFNTYPGNQLRAWQKKWRAGVHEDGSCGSEAVTPPEAGKRRESCLSELGRVLSGYEVDEHCGIHVHVDARDYYWADTYRLLRLYAHVEPLLYLLAGQRRTTNTYAAPVGNAFLKALKEPDPKAAILAVVHGGDGKTEQRYSPNKKATGRYKGLNLAPWVFGRRNRQLIKKKGGKKTVVDGVRADSTFEFRLHENSQDAGRVIAWSNLCVDLVDFVVAMNDKQVADLCRKSPLRALIAASPDSRAFVLNRIRQWRKALPRGATRDYKRRIRVLTDNKHVWAIAS